MAKKRGGKKGFKSEDSDSESVETSSTFSNNHEDSVEEYGDSESMLEGHIDSLYEKRSSTRETAMKGINKLLASNLMIEEVESREETLILLLLTCLKKGGSQEGILACRALGLLAITLGSQDDEISDRILKESSVLLKKISTGSSSTALRSACLELYSLLLLLSPNPPEDPLEDLTFFWGITSPQGPQTPPEVRASALSSWNVLLSFLPAQQVLQHCGSIEFSSRLASLLGERHVSISKKAGESVALLSEAGWDCQLSTHADLASEGQSEEEEEDEGLPSNAVSAELAEAVRQLAISGGGKSLSRQNRQAKRTTFRKVLGALKENGSFRKVTVKLQYGDSLHITNWVGFVQMEILKKFLVEGFQMHLQNNPLLHEIFEFEPKKTKAAGFRSEAEKRMLQSPNSAKSKARTQMRSSNRDFAHASNFGYSDDY